MATKDFWVPTMLAALLVTGFSLVSSGVSLIVTFVPGVVLAYILYLATFYKNLPQPAEVLPLYFLALGVQFLHFAEEHATNFDVAFPALFNAIPYGHNLFVSFNMVAYFMFILGGLALFWHFKPLSFIALFFVAYGVIGNAVAHVIFAFVVQGYFSGLYTSLLYWVLGPLLLRRIWVATRSSPTFHRKTNAHNT